jgi:ketosteroid isomerase-like protein
MKTFIISLLLLCSATACNNNAKKEVATEQEAFIKAYFALFNQHKWEQLANLYAPQVQIKDPAYGTHTITMQPPEILKKYKELQQMVPDVKDSVTTIYSSGNSCIVAFTSTGTDANGKKFSLPICTIMTIEKGKLTADLTYYDNF